MKRAAFAMLASLTVHDKLAGDQLYLNGLVLIEREATDERNLVKKSANWALRSIGKRSNALHTAAVQVAQRLASSPNKSAKWVGRNALKELTSAALLKRLAVRNR